jgi:hypothetical protein
LDHRPETLGVDPAKRGVLFPLGCALPGLKSRVGGAAHHWCGCDNIGCGCDDLDSGCDNIGCGCDDLDSRLYIFDSRLYIFNLGCNSGTHQLANV